MTKIQPSELWVTSPRIGIAVHGVTETVYFSAIDPRETSTLGDNFEADPVSLSLCNGLSLGSFDMGR